MVDPASVDGDDLAGHEGTVVRGEVDERPRQVVGVAPAWDRLALGREGGELALVEVELDLLLGPDRARHHAVHPDAVSTHLAGQGARQSDDAGLGGNVVEEPGHTEVDRDTG